jgi:hypothetical protein
VYNPLLVLFAGHTIKLRLSDDDNPDVPTAWAQASMVARDPVACSRFFNCVIEAFLKYIIGCDGSVLTRALKPTQTVGVLGDIISYYVTVESQNRGGLHAHGLYWMLGALSPAEFMTRLRTATAKGSEFRKRVVAFYDAVIRECIPGGPITDVINRDYKQDSSLPFDDMAAGMESAASTPMDESVDIHAVEPESDAAVEPTAIEPAAVSGYNSDDERTQAAWFGYHVFSCRGIRASSLARRC